MVAGAGVGVDAEALAHDALAGAIAALTSGLLAPLPVELHSDCATSTFGPFSFVVSASRSASRIAGDVVGAA